MTEDMLRAKAGKQIAAVIIVGLVLLIGDIMISGRSSTLELVQGEKGVYMVRPEAGQDAGKVCLHAEVDGRDFSRNFDLNVESVGSGEAEASGNSGDSGGSDGSDDSGNEDGGMSENELSAFEVRSAINSVNDDTTASRIYLPSTLSTGDKVSWSVERRTNTVLILFTIIMMVIFIYRNRFTPLRKQMAAEQESIGRQLPEFVNRLVLLLNAGMVLNSAFEQAIIADTGYGNSGKSMNSGSSDKPAVLRGFMKSASPAVQGDFFFTKMKEIMDRARETNVSVSREFSDFAKSRRCAGGDASRQLLRISNIINDNISKGVELTDKLQRESEFLWLSRKRNCEERGRLAETKLTIPLTIFLLVLIVITVSPALLEL